VATAEVAEHIVRCSTSIWCSPRGGDTSSLVCLLGYPTLLAALHEDLMFGAYAFAASWRVRQATPNTRTCSFMIARASSFPVASSAPACRAMTTTQILSPSARRHALYLCLRPLTRPSLRHFIGTREGVLDYSLVAGVLESGVPFHAGRQTDN
jgi:hypothetical protein